MFRMLNLTCISRSSDIEIFLINIKFFFFNFFFIELCFEINLEIILSKPKQGRHNTEGFLLFRAYMYMSIYMYSKLI